MRIVRQYILGRQHAPDGSLAWVWCTEWDDGVITYAVDGTQYHLRTMDRPRVDVA